MLAGCLLQGSALAWWDTQIMVVKDPPIAMEIDAEAAAPDGVEIVADTPPFGPAPAGGRAAFGCFAAFWRVGIRPDRLRESKMRMANNPMKKERK